MFLRANSDPNLVNLLFTTGMQHLKESISSTH